MGIRTLTPALFVAVSALAAAQPAAKQDRPNILFIMADDHAAHAISAYGSRINTTPNIDRLAREGMRFDNVFCTNSICTPSRASILTGKYSHKNGVPVFNRFDGSQPTVAKHLQAAGYHTGMVGKWHLGGEPTGFDRWTILPGQGIYENPAFVDASGRKTIKGYVTDVITDLALDFLRERPKDQPFFLMLHHKAPHRPWDPDAKHAKLHEAADVPEPPTLRDDHATRASAARQAAMTIARHLTKRDVKGDPPAGLEGDALLKWHYQRYIKDYLRCIASVDDNVGRVLAFLDEEKLAEKTIVIYTSDQGFFLGDHGWYDKRFMYEESLRMPFLVRWPGVVKPGSTQAAMALNVDFAPTFLEAAGRPVPAEMQGRSLAPLLRGVRPADWRTSMYYRYYHDPGDHDTRAHLGVRTETHKLIHFWKSDEWECFDLVADPRELKNIHADPAHAATVAKLKAELARLKKEVDDRDEFAAEQPPQGVSGR